MSRMAAILVFLAVLFVLSTPAGAQEHYQRPASPATSTPLQTFSPEAGFCRNVSVSLGIDTSNDDGCVIGVYSRVVHPLVIQSALNGWNDLAGRELLVVGGPDSPVQVEFWQGSGGSASLLPTRTSAYTGCNIRIPDVLGNRGLLQHEIGHCLGFPDVFDHHHELKLRPYAYLCGYPSHPRNVEYNGIMSYCGDSLLTDDDLCSLFVAGYRESLPEGMQCVMPS